MPGNICAVVILIADGIWVLAGPDPVHMARAVWMQGLFGVSATVFGKPRSAYPLSRSSNGSGFFLDSPTKAVISAKKSLMPNGPAGSVPVGKRSTAADVSLFQEQSGLRKAAGDAPPWNEARERRFLPRVELVDIAT